MANIVESVPFNFDEIYAGVEAKFVAAGYDVQEGSNAMQLATAMAYIGSMLNVNTAVNINETILTLARKRNNVLTDARVLGYEVAHTVSYKYKLRISAPIGTFILPKYTVFTSGNYKYYYLGDQIEEIITAPDSYIDIEVKEGILKKFSDESTLSITIQNIEENGVTVPQYYIDVPFTNIEETGIEMFLTYYDANGILHSNEEWTRSETFLIDKDTILNKQFVRLDDIDYLTPRLYFKLGSVGQDLRVGTVVDMNVLQSSGSAGAITSLPTNSNFTVLSYELVLQGADEESIDSIKYNAPLFHNSANRAITKSDYVAICNRQLTVSNTQVWDGDDEYPQKPGYIWFTFTPSTNTREFSSDSFNINYSLNNPIDKINWYLEDSEIRSNNSTDKGVWDVLDDYKVPTLVFENRHPMYIDFDYNINILRYNVKTSVADINASVFNVINNYFLGVNEENPIERFNSEYFQSSLSKRIDMLLTDITGFEMSLETSLVLLDKHVSEITDSLGNSSKHCFVPLAWQFEKMFDSSKNVIISNLPSIDTTNFYDGKDLTLDETSLSGNEDSKIININILLGTEIVGVYRIFNGTKKYILVDLYIENDKIPENSIDGLKIDIKYPSPNLQCLKNCIPRLNKVTFN